MADQGGNVWSRLDGAHLPRHGLVTDVLAIIGPVPADTPHNVVGPFPGCRDRCSKGRDTQDPAAVGHHLSVLEIGAGMKHLEVRFPIRETRDEVTFPVLLRISAGGHDHPEGGPFIPRRMDPVQGPIQGGQTDLRKIGLEAQHDGLCFRVPAAAVELQHLDLAVGVKS